LLAYRTSKFGSRVVCLVSDVDAKHTICAVTLDVLIVGVTFGAHSYWPEVLIGGNVGVYPFLVVVLRELLAHIAFLLGVRASMLTLGWKFYAIWLTVNSVAFGMLVAASIGCGL
jgi:hypothetical protein